MFDGNICTPPGRDVGPRMGQLLFRFPMTMVHPKIKRVFNSIANIGDIVYRKARDT